MTRLRALNETSSDDSEEENEEKETIEAQEERAFSLYKKALEFRQQEKYSDAENLLIALLNDDFLVNVCTENQPDGPDGLARPATALKYACLKNLGNILVLQERAEDGLRCFIQAVELDESDVTMWHQMGQVALKIDNFDLASQAFQEGLRCNARHWPCLDSLLPVLYALNDYLGCLLLVSRTLQLDPEYPQALALRHQISKEHPSLLQSFKHFFPDENDILEVSVTLPEEELSNLVSYALCLQERNKTINARHWSDVTSNLDGRKLTVSVNSNTWESLGKILLKTYKSVIPSADLSYLHLVKIDTPESCNSTGVDTCDDQLLPSNTASSSVADLETELMDVDSEQDVKGEDQTEEDATEASGLEQEEEAKATSTVQENSSTLKRKRKRASLALMDQWSKRRSGRRSGRKVDDREESNLASCFRSLLPVSLLPKDLEAEIAKASKRRSLRDPVELLAWGDDSMDTVELCRLLQERDAKDEQQRKQGQCSKDNVALHLMQENYFGTEKEHSDVSSFIRNIGSGTNNIVELFIELIKQLSQKESLTWPSGLVPIYTEVYECIRTHIPYSSPVDEVGFTNVNLTNFVSTLLFCELFVDLWQQNNQKDQDILGEKGVVFSEALGQVMLLSGVTHIFSTPAEQCKMMIRIHWLKVHLYLIQENSSLAINSLQDVLESLDIAENMEICLGKETSQILQLQTKSDGNTVDSDLSSSEKSEQVLQGTSVLGNVETCPQNVEPSIDIALTEIIPEPESGEKSKKAKSLPSVQANVSSNSSDSTKKSNECTENSDLSVQSDVCITNLTGVPLKRAVDCIPDVEMSDLHSDEQACHLTLETDSSHPVIKHTIHDKEVDAEMPVIDTQKDDCTMEIETPEDLHNSVELMAKTEKLDEPDMDKSLANDRDDSIPQRESVQDFENSIQLMAKVEKLDEYITDIIPDNIRDESILDREETDQEIKTELQENIFDLDVTNETPDSIQAKGDLIQNACSEGKKSDTCMDERIKADINIADSLEKQVNCDESVPDGDVACKEIISKGDVCLSSKEIVPNVDNLKSAMELNIDQTSLVEEADTSGFSSPQISSFTSEQKQETSTTTPCSVLSNNDKALDGKSTQGGNPSHDLAVATLKSNCNIILANSRMSQTINKRNAQKLLTSLSRQHQLSEVDDLYRKGQYEILASTLTECFKYCAQQVDIDNPELDSLPDRPTQMAMLLDSLWQLKRYSDCFYWTEACLHEAFNRYLNSADSDNPSQEEDDHQTWATTVERLLAGLNGCLKVAGLQLLEMVPKTCLTRLVQTLTSMLCQQLEQSDCSVEMAIECTTPWVILHRIVYFEEQLFPNSQDFIPSHMSILLTAHDCMAKRFRCCLNEGILLNLILDVFVPQIRCFELSSFRGKLNHEVEQAIFCLYGHPKKGVDRSKKKLQDHKVHQHLELTWERSQTLLKFYEPDELPTFDVSSSKISPDEEQLFLRVVQLVPEDINPSQYLHRIKAFVNGSLDTFPDLECRFPESAWNLYYLLADYYLKTFKWEAAVKYYMLDVCLNPNRFDSWAGMALARATLLTLQINSCDTLKNEVQLCRKTKAQQCFQKAVDLDLENTTMWIEFGNFAYTVHSFCSRLLKTETDSLSMEMFTKVEEEKDKMLSLTEKCFKTAEKLGQDERWLQQYMLGKVAEKRGEGPIVFLQHYRAAARLLHESNAEYPLVLNYEPTQLYAFEAHEVYYRIHASILKSLESMEGKYLSTEVESLYEETLNEAACSPFMATRSQSRPSLTNVGNQLIGAKRSSVDPSETSSKKLKMDETAVVEIVEYEEAKALKAESVGSNQQLNATTSSGTFRMEEQTIGENKPVESSDIRKLVTTEVKPEHSENNVETAESTHVSLNTLVTNECTARTADISNKNLETSGHCNIVQRSSENDFENSKLSGSIIHEVKIDTGHEISQVGVNSLTDVKEDLRLPDLRKTAENSLLMDSKQQSVSESGCKTGASSTCEVDNDKCKKSLFVSMRKVIVEVEHQLLANNVLTSCNSVGRVGTLSGLGVGGVDLSRNKVLHGNVSVVKEHDYAAPYTGAVHKPTRYQSQDSCTNNIGDVNKALNFCGIGKVPEIQKIDEDITSMLDVNKCSECGKEGESDALKGDLLPLPDQFCNLNKDRHFIIDINNSRAHCKNLLMSNVSIDKCPTSPGKKNEMVVSLRYLEEHKISSSEKIVCGVTSVSGSAIPFLDTKSEEPTKGNNKSITSINSTDTSGSSSSSTSSSSDVSSDESEGSQEKVDKKSLPKENVTQGSTKELVADLSTTMNEVRVEKSNYVKELQLDTPGSQKEQQTDNLKLSKELKTNNPESRKAPTISNPGSMKESSKEVLPDILQSEKISCDGRNLDHSGFVSRCVVAIEECLVRYPRHYKSFYRLCHYYFHSKQHRNVKKCRQLLLGDYRVARLNKNINGLFKSQSINSMFNDVWRMPIEEIDRAGSFASHMSRCVLLLMELLGAVRDHALLLKLSVFLKRDPEKKDKKYLRDNERVDLSKQALMMCLAALRQSVNQTRTPDNVIDIYRTVKDGLKEMPQKEGVFKGLLSDAFKKLGGLSKGDVSLYEVAVDFCQNELNLRKAAAEAKVVAQAQAQAQAHAQVQAQVQAQAQALQMGVGVIPPTLPFNTLTPRFPSGVNAPPVMNPLGNPMFLPHMPVYRGRGRPPKAQQRLQSAMISMAHMISLGNAVSQGQGLMDSSKVKIKHHQKQRRPQNQPVSSSGSPGPVVSTLIKDRPAISITALHTNKTTSQSNAAAVGTSATASTSNVGMRTDSPLPPNMSNVDMTKMWPVRPQHIFPGHLPGTTDPRSILKATGASRMSNVVRNPRFKSAKKITHSTTNDPRGFYRQPPGPYVPQPQANKQTSNPAALLSRLPGLQVKQRPHPGLSTTSHSQAFGYSEQSKALKSKVRESLPGKQQLQRIDKPQKLLMSSSQSSKSVISISKVSASSQSGQGMMTSTDVPEPKKISDPNFDIITLD